MSSKPEPLPQIAGIHAYVPGEEAPEVDGRAHKLASNENPLGTSEKAKAVYRDQAEELWLYPDGDVGALRGAIAKRHGLDPARIVCGAGSDEIFQLLGRAYLGVGDEMIATRHAFAIYAIVGQQSGATVVEVDEDNFRANVDAILAAVTPKTKIVWLANPNNPTGTYIPFDEVKRLHAGLPSNVLLVLDGAYAEYVQRNDYASGIELASQFENVIVTRTFSKIYGLAGARLGWGFVPLPVADSLNRVRGPFNVSRAAQLAGVAALEDSEFLDTSIAHNNRGLKVLTDGLEAMGLSVLDGVCNFVVVQFPDEDGKRAADVLAYLKTRGITVRGLGGYRMPEHIRISVGTDDANADVLAEIKLFLDAS